MQIYLQRSQNEQDAQSVFNELKRVVETPQNTVLAYDNDCATFGLTETYFEVYAPNGNLILRCDSCMIRAGAYNIFLPHQLNRQLFEICKIRAVPAPNVAKVQVAQVSTYLKRFQGKSI